MNAEFWLETPKRRYLLRCTNGTMILNGTLYEGLDWIQQSHNMV